MSQTNHKTIPFNTQKSIEKAANQQLEPQSWFLLVDGKKYIWTSTMDRVGIIRKGIPYGSIEFVSKKLKKSVKSVLLLLGLPQTTYNKKKSEHAVLDSRNSELILLIVELIDYGFSVFNNEEEKFHRWLKKSNLSMDGNTPESMLDTITGINEVKFCLDRIEYGNLA